MKIQVAVAVVVGVLVSGAGSARAASVEVCGTGGMGLNFRSGPSLNAPIQTAYSEGRTFTTLGTSASGDWTQVRDASGRTGWVYSAYTCPSGGRPVASNGSGGTAARPSPVAQQAPAAACGVSSRIMASAKSIGDQINRTGGYRFDGVNDCYGFVRRVWDPVLREMGMSALPTGDVGSSSWSRIGSWDQLQPGDVLSTHQGHAWGAQWHGGLYAGKINGVHYIHDNSGSQSAKLRPVPYGSYFSYFYRPTHGLTAAACTSAKSGGTGGTTLRP